ncbi:MAG: hypothetical protein P8N98_11085, partial [Paracoccaceae bacterium]|nr:hypothetical protein [Paracoccaceae bacterium]
MDDDEAIRAELFRKIEALAVSPESYTDLTDDLVVQAKGSADALDRFEASASRDLAHALDQATLLQQREAPGRTAMANLRLSTSPAYLIRADGVIIGSNEAALNRAAGAKAERVEALAYQPDDAETLGALVRGTALNGDVGQGVSLHPARDADDRRATLAVMASPIGPDAAPGALLFIVDPVMRPETVDLMGRAYGLTGAETEILAAFCDGASLRQIAEDRGRSHATIRTQFQSIAEKTGVGGQAELMRSSQAMSRFTEEIGGLARATSRPTRKRFDVMRPGGRSVEVLRCSDPAGAPAIFMHGAKVYSFPTATEAAFRDAGSFYIIGRPGFGQSDPEPDSADRDQTIADDILAVLSQIGVEQAPFLAHSGGVPEVFRVAAKGLAAAIERLVIVGSLPPPSYVARHAGASATMTAALMLAARSNKALLRLLLSGRLRMYLRMGVARFLAKKFAASPSDTKLAARDDVIAEFDAAVEFTTAQGYGAGA